MPATKDKAKESVCDARCLNEGTKWSRISYGSVIDFDEAEVIVENEAGMRWSVTRPIFEAEFHVPDQHTKTDRVTQTKMAEIVLSSARIVMTVMFRKKPELKILCDLVWDTLDRCTMTRRNLDKLLKEATKGEVREMVGRHYGTVDGFGRLSFIDMEATTGPSRIRKVDPRTIEWAIINGTRYELKG